MNGAAEFKLASAKVPVLVLGGKENSLGTARSLGRHGIKVRVSGPSNCWGMNSRYCAERFPIPFGTGAAAFWTALLLSPRSAALHGHIIFPCSDEALEFVAENHGELSRNYILGPAEPRLTLAMLDKQRTLALAEKAGIPCPRHWQIDNLAALARISAEVKFPVLVKPLHSHKFVKVFGKKLFVIEKDVAELSAKVALALEHGLGVTVVEMIPGPDTQLSSYNTFITDTGENLFHFTKRVIRRYPENSGNGCCHVTAWEPETAAMGQKLFKALGTRGFANVEFKRDLRDDQLKLIEVNSRFTAAHQLFLSSGAPIDLMIYCHLTDQPGPTFASFTEGLRLWYPFNDFLSFLQLRRKGRLSLGGWLKSIGSGPLVFPSFSVTDLWPSITARLANAERLIRGRG